VGSGLGHAIAGGTTGGDECQRRRAAPPNHSEDSCRAGLPVRFVSSLEVEFGGAAGRFGQLTVAAVRRRDGSRVATKKIEPIGHQLSDGNKATKVVVARLYLAAACSFSFFHFFSDGAACSGAADAMVYQTVGNRTGLTGNRSDRSGPVPVWSGMITAKF